MQDKASAKTAEMSARPALIGVLGALSAFGAASLDMYLPALPTIAAEFSVGPERIQASVGAFLLGFALGMLVYGPLSDQFGRRPALTTGILFYIGASLGCALATDATTFIALRFVQALGGGAATALARAMVRDLFTTTEGARVLSMMALVLAVMPLLAPSLGGAVLLASGWRTIFLILAAFGAATLAAVWVWAPETLEPARRKPARPAAIARGYAAILRAPRALQFLLAGGAAYAGLMAFVTGSPYAFIVHFQIPPERFGLFFALCASALVAGNALNIALVGRYGLRWMLRVGASVAGASGALLLIEGFAGVFSFAGLVASLCFFLACVNLCVTNSVAGLMALYRKQAGAASALFGATQFGLGALANLGVGLLDDGTPRGLCLVIGACATLCAATVLAQAELRRRGGRLAH